MRNLSRLCSLLGLLLLPAISYGNSIEVQLENLLAEKIGESTSQIELHIDKAMRARYSTIIEEDFDYLELTAFTPAQSSFRAQLKMKDGKAYDVYGRYTAYIDAPVTNHPVKTGSILTERDITLTRTKLAKLRMGYLLNDTQVIGMQAKHNLPPGVMLKDTDLTKPVVIKPKDIVTVIYQHSNIKLRTQATALESGAIGDVITVRNETTGSTVYGRVKNKNLVEVSSD